MKTILYKAMYIILTIVMITTIGVLLVAKDLKIEEVDALNEEFSYISNEEVEIQDEAEIVLLAGADDRRRTNGEHGDPNIITGMRADALNLIVMPKNGSRITSLSIPRDTLVSRPKCQVWNERERKYSIELLTPATDVKINSTLSDGGPSCLVDTVEELIGYNITRYAQVDFRAFEDIVDSLGGVQMCFDTPVEDEILGTIIADPGTFTVDGKTALSLARARHVIGTGMSDFERGYSQQKILSAIFSEMKKNINKPLTLFNVVRNGVDNVSGDGLEYAALINILRKASSVPDDKIVFATTPLIDDGYETGEVKVNQEELRTIIKDSLYETVHEIPQEELYEVPPRENQRVVVRGNDINGSVTVVSDHLRALGWEVMNIDYDSEESYISFSDRSAGSAVQLSLDTGNTLLRDGSDDPETMDMLNAGPVITMSTLAGEQNYDDELLTGLMIPYPVNNSSAQDYKPVNINNSPTDQIVFSESICG